MKITTNTTNDSSHYMDKLAEIKLENVMMIIWRVRETGVVRFIYYTADGSEMLFECDSQTISYAHEFDAKLKVAENSILIWS